MTKQEKDHSTLILFSIVAVLFLVALVGVMYVKNASQKKVETEYSNGFTFTKKSGFWHTDIKNAISGQMYGAEFRYSPDEVREIPVEGNPKMFLIAVRNATSEPIKAAYFTFDPSSNSSSLAITSLVAADLSRFMNSLNGIMLVAGCTRNETTGCSDRPIITCENQVRKARVVYVKEAVEPKIIFDGGNCLTIEGSGQDIIKAQNKLMFLWYGIL